MNTTEPINIVIADDDTEDRLLAQNALEESRLKNNLFMVEDGEDLLDFLKHRGKYQDRSHSLPDLILLDLNMPRKNGIEALQEIRSDDALKHIPIVVLTTSQAEQDVLKTYKLGVNSYITKPVTFEGLVELMKTLELYWFQIVKLPRE